MESNTLIGTKSPDADRGEDRIGRRHSRESNGPALIKTLSCSVTFRALFRSHTYEAAEDAKLRRHDEDEDRMRLRGKLWGRQSMYL
jgi:hypothetical protein